jgi:hypothetical protein
VILTVGQHDMLVTAFLIVGHFTLLATVRR